MENLKCFLCGKDVDDSPCSYDGGEHKTRPDNVFEFKFVMPLNRAQEMAWHTRLDALNTANDGSNPMYYEDEIVPAIWEMFNTFLRENDTGLYDAETKLLDDKLEDLAGKN